MSKKYNRHQSVISKHSDSQQDEDNWVNKLEQSLTKDAVQPRSVDNSLFHQINDIMNGGTKSKYTSVDAAVEDMKARSGLTAYLSKMNKISEEEKVNTKVAQEQAPEKSLKVPMVIKKCPQIKNTLENIIRDTKGNNSIPAIIERVKRIHHNDVSEDKDWDEDSFVRLVSQLNLRAKQQNPTNYEQHNNLGTMDQVSDSDLNPSNTDAFNILMPSSNN
jgi:hypothetical protein